MRNFPSCFVGVTKQILMSTLFIFLSYVIIAQTRVTGKVNGPDAKPVFGATVTVKGTSVATTTGSDGAYSIVMPPNHDVLIISYIGYEVSEVNVRGNNAVDVTMKVQTTSLNEVIVTGYSAQRKKDITGSIAVVNVNNYKQIPGGNAEGLLQGQASGVTVTTSGVPGGGAAVRIRGITSLGNANPLYIVDGVQSGTGLRDINPDDVESIQVLKDAGAAAIYGIQGSNGVIIVTTKKGRGKPTVTYDSYIGTQRPLSGNVWNLTGTQGYAQAIWNMESNSGVIPSKRTPQFGLTGTAPVIPDYVLPEGAKEGDPKTDPSTYNISSNQIMKANKTGTDWFHEIFKPAMIQNHTVSVSAGNDRSSYFFSFNYFDQDGTLIKTYLKRYDVRMNTLFNVKNNIRVGENAYLVYRKSPGFTNQNEGNSISHTYRIPPIIPVYDIMGNFGGTHAPHLSNAENPVARQKRTENNKTNSWSMIGNVFADVDFLKHFTAHTSFGGSIENYYFYSFSPTPYNNAEGNTNANAFSENAGYNSLWQWTNTLTYSNVIGLHNFKVLGGIEAKKIYNRSFSAGRINYFSTDPSYLILNTGSPTAGVSNNGGSPFQRALYSQFGRLDYSYNDRYLLSGTLRRDGASVFAADNRWGTFPSVTVGWRISQEDFFRSVTFINDLKLRGGWGKLGSINNIGATNAYTLYASGAGYSYYPISGDPNGATQGFYQSQFGNTATTWEEDIISNVGLDATLLNNKLSLSLEWYKKKISGLLFQKQSQIGNYAGGASQPIINSGDIQNQGFDFTGTYRMNIAKDFHFDVTANITTYKSKIISLPPGYKYVDYNSSGSTRIGAFTRAQPGEPIGEFFGYKVIGIFQDAGDVAKSPKQDAANPGRFKFADVNGDNVVNDQDRTWIGNPNPDFTYGLTLNASYKNFDFSAFFYGSQGADVVNYVKYWTNFPQVFRGGISNDALNKSAILVNSAGQPTTILDPTAHVANPDATVPVLETNGNTSNSGKFNSFYVENGSFLKCRSIMLGYTIPSSPLKRVGIDKIRVYIQGSNLFTITKYTGLDPELQQSDLNNNSNFGIDFGNYPANQKMYLFGITASF
jgi:TonB-linked SusC/RagA family outer membrane protein